MSHFQIRHAVFQFLLLLLLPALFFAILLRCPANANNAASVTSITHLFTVAATQAEAVAAAEAEAARQHMLVGNA